ncbi:MAG: hypothetical protein J0H14_14435 [Alphaproteobacteria bacterium]|nr:hypothetical protein [Alphaproteobacteria bacterium]
MSDTPERPDLGFIGHQFARLINDVATLREDLNGLTAIVLRQVATLTALLTEVRAIHGQHSRLGNRVRALEEKMP